MIRSLPLVARNCRTKELAIFFFLTVFVSSGALAAQDSPSVAQRAISEVLSKDASSPEQAGCNRENPAEVIVCGHSEQRYRIDPAVIAATRAAEAAPPKPPITAQTAEPCTGPDCGGGTIPLIGMALTAIKAAELAVHGDDWRDALRTRPDQYQVYLQRKNQGKERISIGVSAGNR